MTGGDHAAPERAGTGTPRRRGTCRQTPAAARRTRCPRRITCCPARRWPSYPHEAREAPSGITPPKRGGPCSPAPTARQARRPPGQAGHRSARCGASWPASPGTRRAGRPGRGEHTRSCGQPARPGPPRRLARHADRRLLAVPDPDRRASRLRAAAPRARRPGWRDARHPVHIHAGAHRVVKALPRAPPVCQPRH